VELVTWGNLRCFGRLWIPRPSSNPLGNPIFCFGRWMTAISRLVFFACLLASLQLRHDGAPAAVRETEDWDGIEIELGEVRLDLRRRLIDCSKLPASDLAHLALGVGPGVEVEGVSIGESAQVTVGDLALDRALG
jgi:hypothetical protein